ncbi:DUF4260 domain-containing protein [Gracilibacillus halotolerans]|uniref:DUF4260 domain-containing protein n=1 Tax=Gracilibacillus halotolerans TaxID=74386 RepID=UPI00160EA09E|nr:DUF4260 domain-containing protein [Gracilibacillus halotolerans]
MNKIILQVESLVVLLACLYFYSFLEFNWVLFFVLLLAPDVFMVGYLINKKAGALLYNVVHTYSLSIIITVLGVILSNPVILSIGLIWTAHIGMDRCFGIGLKYQTGFKDTHFNRV